MEMEMFKSKLAKYLLAFAMFLFYAIVVFESGFIAAIVLFFKVLGLVIFGMAHVWIADSVNLLNRVKWSKLWSSISSLVSSRPSQSSSC